MRTSLISKSKFLSLVLRHDPGVIGLTLDQNGWADIDELLAHAAVKGHAISVAELAEIVETNGKKRFDWDISRKRIRANQGHSVEVDLELEPAVPPKELFHGTAVKNRVSILAQGLIRGARQYVHLSTDIATARAVGSRHGSPVVFRVATEQMIKSDYVFFVSKNGVWLTECVPARFLREV